VAGWLAWAVAWRPPSIPIGALWGSSVRLPQPPRPPTLRRLRPRFGEQMRTLTRPIPLLALASIALGGCNADLPAVFADATSDTVADTSANDENDSTGDVGGEVDAGPGDDTTTDISVDGGTDSVLFLDANLPDMTEPDVGDDGTTTDVSVDGGPPTGLTPETRQAVIDSIEAYCVVAVLCASQGEYIEPSILSVEACIRDYAIDEYDTFSEGCGLAYVDFAECVVENGECVSGGDVDGQEYFVFEVDDHGPCETGYAAYDRECD
jgi:hypothetical protein